VFPYSLLGVGPGADPGAQAVSPQVTISHPPGGRLPVLSDGPVVTFPAAKHHCPLAGTKLYCLVTEAVLRIQQQQHNIIDHAFSCRKKGYSHLVG